MRVRDTIRRLTSSGLRTFASLIWGQGHRWVAAVFRHRMLLGRQGLERDSERGIYGERGWKVDRETRIEKLDIALRAEDTSVNAFFI